MILGQMGQSMVTHSNAVFCVEIMVNGLDDSVSHNPTRGISFGVIGLVWWFHHELKEPLNR